MAGALGVRNNGETHWVERASSVRRTGPRQVTPPLLLSP